MLAFQLLNILCSDGDPQLDTLDDSDRVAAERKIKKYVMKRMKDKVRDWKPIQ